MKRLVILIALVICTGTVWAQNQTLTFTSITDAKFFVYLNGKLQNERSSGIVTLNNLEDKEYHIRIVIDDPFEIAVTRTIKPDNKHNEYTVQFNAVRERVYLRQASTALKNQEGDNNLWMPQDPTPTDTLTATPARPHTSIRRTNISDSTTQQLRKQIRTQTMEY